MIRTVSSALTRTHTLGSNAPAADTFPEPANWGI